MPAFEEVPGDEGVGYGRQMMMTGEKKDEVVSDANEDKNGDEPGGEAVVEGQMEAVHPASSTIFHGTDVDYYPSSSPTLVTMGVKFDEDEASVSYHLDS